MILASSELNSRFDLISYFISSNQGLFSITPLIFHLSWNSVFINTTYVPSPLMFIIFEIIQKWHCYKYYFYYTYLFSLRFFEKKNHKLSVFSCLFSKLSTSHIHKQIMVWLLFYIFNFWYASELNLVKNSIYNIHLL